MWWGCFAAGGTGALHKIDGIMRTENYVDILKQHLKTSVRKLKLGSKWVFKWTLTPSILPKLWQNGLRTTKSSGHHKALTSVRRNGPKFIHCGKLVEGYPKRLTQIKKCKGNATKY
ncbi:unnamed protein product [Oncorhynchus mykiss]|uniref:Uncharacterized protein n=1 Tax=Oncorhynchus mykiss TaxID=8022 RepID=A0A060WB05_ONCMY|nr:unnamed protein product [Oncorhynchus mykiss]